MKTFWKKITPYFLGISVLGSSSAVAWEIGWIEIIYEYFCEEVPIASKQETSLEILPSPKADSSISKHTESIFNSDSTPSPIDFITWIDSEEEEDIHSSKMKQNPASKTQKPTGNRIGCICMDDDRQNKRGTGACSGHGGVRFWLYQQESGWILEFPTKRHKKHPAPLSYEERTRLASFKIKDKTSDKQSSFLDLLMLVICCLTIAYIAKLWWEKKSV